MHYKIASALNSCMPYINNIALSNDLHIVTQPEFIVNDGIIDVKVLSPFSNLLGMSNGLHRLGFCLSDWYNIGGCYYRIQITGYLGG